MKINFSIMNSAYEMLIPGKLNTLQTDSISTLVKEWRWMKDNSKFRFQVVSKKLQQYGLREFDEKY